MKTVLIVVTLVEVGLVVAVLATYLLLIAATLRTVARTLGLVTFGVRAIEKQTEPLGPVLEEINGALLRVAELLGLPPAKDRVQERSVESVEHGSPSHISGGGS